MDIYMSECICIYTHTYTHKYINFIYMCVFVYKYYDSKYL